MANDKRKRNLDLAAGTALTGIDRALVELATDDRRPDEFTASELHRRFCAAGYSDSLDSVRQRLARKARLGELLSRKTLISAKWTAVYRYPDPEKS